MMSSNQKSSMKWKKQNACNMDDVLHKKFQARSKETYVNYKKYPLEGGRTQKVYLPAVNQKQLHPQTGKYAISQSFSTLYSGHHSSVSSIISRRKFQINKKQEHQGGLKKHSKQSNVTMTVTYLGQGPMANFKDEMKVLQQICGGENVCVFRGDLHPGDQFQFVSRRQSGFPFSVSLLVNGIMAARITSCCEYHYSPGFLQGKGNCFEFTDLRGGEPCFRCLSIRYKNGRKQHESKGNRPVSTVGKHVKGENESCPSSPLFIPIRREMSLLRLSRKDFKDVNSTSSDTEDTNNHVQANRGQKEINEQHRKKKVIKREYMEESHTKEPKMAEVEQGAHIKKSKRERPNKKKICKNDIGASMTVEDRRQLREDTSVGYLCGDTSNSELELSDESESTLCSKNRSLRKGLRAEKEGAHNHATNGVGYSNSLDPNQLDTQSKEMTMRPISQAVAETEHDLETQVEAIISKLQSCDLVEQLVLRNTGLTDELLNCLVTALKNSPSEVVLINLNLNNIGPPGVQALLNLIRLKPQVKGLLLFGNHLGDKGVSTLLNGLADMQGQTVELKTLQLRHGEAKNMDTALLPKAVRSSIIQELILTELDLGGNGVSGEGLRVLSSYLRCHSKLQYLGLAKTNVADISAWENLFDSLTSNAVLTHIILDECHLGDHGAEFFAKMLRHNQSLNKIDLDYNSIGDHGGKAIIEALVSRRFLLYHLSLEGNYINLALMNKIKQEIPSSNN